MGLDSRYSWVRYSWWRLALSLVIAVIGNAGMWAGIWAGIWARIWAVIFVMPQIRGALKSPPGVLTVEEF
ncbi:MAG: hypothetical protein AAFQ15_15585 [Pseudomonadota bacterium]